MAVSVDPHTFQLASLEQQYVQVEKETRKLEEELQNSRRKRHQLDVEVRFLRRKLKSFKRSLDQYGQTEAPVATHSDDHSHETDDPQEHMRLASGDPARQRSPESQSDYSGPIEDEPQFLEVEVKLGDLKSLEKGIIRSSPLEYSPTFVEYESDSPHKYAGKGRVSWQDEEPLSA